MMPWRRFSQTQFCGLVGIDSIPAGVTFDQQANWNDEPITRQLIGDGKAADGTRYTWQALFRPADPSYTSQTSMDKPCAAEFEMVIAGPEINTIATANFYLNHGWYTSPASPLIWSSILATGQTYDGETAWATFPHRLSAGATIKFSAQIITANLPIVQSAWAPAWNNTTNALQLPKYIDEWFRNGWFFRASNYGAGDPSGWAVNKYFKVDININNITVKYFNPVVNSISRAHMTTAGGIQIILTGLGFNNSDADIEEGGDANPNPWNDLVDLIKFEGLQGQGTTTLTRALGHFTVDSNTQITIPAMPAMAAGTYHVQLEKDAHAIEAACGDPTAYAGDWSTGTDGQVIPSIRMIFLVADEYHPRPDGDTPMLLTKWTFTKGDDSVFKWYSFIDTTTTDVFFSGKILSCSGIRRAVDDMTGLPQFSEATIVLSNADKEFSKLLAQYIAKNNIVEIYTAFKSQPAAFRVLTHRMIIEDHSRPGAVIEFRLREIAAKYFSVSIPRYFVTEEDYPDADESALTQPMPEVLGLCSLTTGDDPGAVEALYTDITTFEYLAARGSMKAIDQVYGDGLLIDPGEYAIVYKDGGRTFIRFTADQEGKRITFNGKGYIYGPWNSANNYVQSPAYIAAFALCFLANIPVNYLDLASFDEVHDLLAAAGFGEAGHYAIQGTQDLSSILQELLFTAGAKLYPDSRGILKLGIKNIADFESPLILREQIDLIGEGDRRDNLQDAFNSVNAQYGYYPAPGKFTGTLARERADSIADYGATIQRSSPLEFKWTIDADLVEARTQEELYRYGYGNFRLSFQVTFDFFDDLEIFTNFRYQDPWGLSITGNGESGRYYYVESLEYNYAENRIQVEAVDLQWLLRAYFILGDEEDHAAAWADAVEASRMYGYLCDEVTGKLPGGDPGKILIDENLIGE